MAMVEIGDVLVPYEQLREANMRRNLSILADLGISNDVCTLELSARVQSESFEHTSRTHGKRRSRTSLAKR